MAVGDVPPPAIKFIVPQQLRTFGVSSPRGRRLSPCVRERERGARRASPIWPRATNATRHATPHALSSVDCAPARGLTRTKGDQRNPGVVDAEMQHYERSRGSKPEVKSLTGLGSLGETQQNSPSVASRPTPKGLVAKFGIKWPPCAYRPSSINKPRTVQQDVG
jgi:hypothetical protein